MVGGKGVGVGRVLGRVWGLGGDWERRSRFFWREKSSQGNYHFPLELVDGLAAHFFPLKNEGLITSQCLDEEVNPFLHLSHP